MENPDMQLGVAFYAKAVENPRKSAEAGRPIYDNKEYVHIRFPADGKRELHAPAHEVHFVSHAKQQMTYAERFPEVYKAFKDADEDFVHGTPISELPTLTEARRAELRAQKIRTVEQLAGLPDSTLRRMGMGAREMQEQAKAFLDAAKGTAETVELKRRISELEKMLSATAAPPPEKQADQFDGMTDDDLRNVLTDAGVEVDGRWGRKRLAEEINKLAAKTEAA
jgi:ribosomal protein L12E/L44/L45/RPP1/RPP2